MRRLLLSSITFVNSIWDDDWDKRKPRTPEHSPVASRHLLLVRHGQYYRGASTEESRCLTPLGRVQAKLTGVRLAQLDLPYSKIFCSNMTRAIETADYVAEEIKDELLLQPADPILREGAPIRPEPNDGRWLPEADYHVSGARIEAAFRKYFHRAENTQKVDSYEVVVAHANVIRYFVCRALQFEPEAWLRFSLKHGSITWVEIRPDGTVILRAFGDAGHFPPEMLTTSISPTA